MTDMIPTWLQPIQLEEWPTTLLSQPLLKISLPLPLDWHSQGVKKLTPQEKEEIFRGPDQVEGLSLNYMTAVDPTARLANWLEPILSITGYPLPSLLPTDAEPTLLDWEAEEPSEAERVRLGVNELLLYQGVAFFREPYPTLARLYVLMARRDREAWKVGLSFMSACPPGAPQAMIDQNDHVRAGASFGELKFL